MALNYIYLFVCVDKIYFDLFSWLVLIWWFFSFYGWIDQLEHVQFGIVHKQRLIVVVIMAALYKLTITVIETQKKQQEKRRKKLNSVYRINEQHINHAFRRTFDLFIPHLSIYFIRLFHFKTKMPLHSIMMTCKLYLQSQLIKWLF